MVQRAHRVEEVGDARDLFEGRVGEVEVGVRVTGGDGDPAPAGRLRKLRRALQLRGQGEHAHRPEVQELIEEVWVGRDDVGRRVRASPVRVYERAFEVDAQNLGTIEHTLARQVGELRQRLAIEVSRGRDQGGQVARDPGGREPPRQLRHAPRLGSDVHPECTVHLQVHEARTQEAVAVLADLVGRERLAAHVLYSAPFEEDRALRPDLVVRDYVSTQRDCLQASISTLFEVSTVRSQL